MDELLEETLNNIEALYRDGGDREQTLAKLETVKARVDAFVEDLV